LRWNSASSQYAKAQRPALAFVFLKRLFSAFWPFLRLWGPDDASNPAWAEQWQMMGCGMGGGFGFGEEFFMEESREIIRVA